MRMNINMNRNYMNMNSFNTNNNNNNNNTTTGNNGQGNNLGNINGNDNSNSNNNGFQTLNTSNSNLILPHSLPSSVGISNYVNNHFGIQQNPQSYLTPQQLSALSPISANSTVSSTTVTSLPEHNLSKINTDNHLLNAGYPVTSIYASHSANSFCNLSNKSAIIYSPNNSILQSQNQCIGQQPANQQQINQFYNLDMTSRNASNNSSSSSASIQLNNINYLSTGSNTLSALSVNSSNNNNLSAFSNQYEPFTDDIVSLPSVESSIPPTPSHLESIQPSFEDEILFGISSMKIQQKPNQQFSSIQQQQSWSQKPIGGIDVNYTTSLPNISSNMGSNESLTPFTSASDTTFFTNSTSTMTEEPSYSSVPCTPVWTQSCPSLNYVLPQSNRSSHTSIGMQKQINLIPTSIAGPDTVQIRKWVSSSTICEEELDIFDQGKYLSPSNDLKHISYNNRNRILSEPMLSFSNYSSEDNLSIGNNAGIDSFNYSKPDNHDHYSPSLEDVKEGENVKIRKDGSRVFSCFISECHRQFGTGAGLRYHLKTVHNTTTERAARIKAKPRNVFCELCPGKNFSTNAGLRYHRKTIHSAD